jgi:hypothetical protein
MMGAQTDASLEQHTEANDYLSAPGAIGATGIRRVTSCSPATPKELRFVCNPCRLGQVLTLTHKLHITKVCQ